MEDDTSTIMGGRRLNQAVWGWSASDSTLVELLRGRAAHSADQRAYTFLIDGETEGPSLTYAQLDQRARTIAAQLGAWGAQGQRALLLYMPGLEFLEAFFGCLYAGVIAVPTYPPHNARSLSTIRGIVADAGASLALSTSSLLSLLRAQPEYAADLSSMRWLATDDLESGRASDWQAPSLTGETLAFLQYTSGSTGAPKGVMVSHANLLHNERLIAKAFENSDETLVVGWLPLFHDMGLIGNVLQPLCLGVPSVLMSPVAFLQKPLRWLRAISHYRASTSGGPNFAYELCVRKIPPEQRADLDLSCWQVAFNGAEPVRAGTLARFAAAFEGCGFRRQAFYPCYGLAESTLFVTGGPATQPPLVRPVDKSALAQNRVLAPQDGREGVCHLVASGQTWPDQPVTIVDPHSLTPCPPGTVGEIWVSGPSVAQGYWEKPNETERVFQAHLADSDEGPFLRTGDLGVVMAGQLFVTGRLKDLIIIRGRNHYPQDIELTVAGSQPVLRPGCGAAFSVDVTEQERLVIVQELRWTADVDLDGVIDGIRQAVAERHELEAYAVVLLPPKTIPKTSSGKLQRHACRAAFLDGSLPALARSRLEVEVAPAPPADWAELPVDGLTKQVVALVRRVVSNAKGRPVPVELGSSLRDHLGLDSLGVVELAASVESAFDVRIGEGHLPYIDTVGDLVDVVCRSAQGNGSGDGQSGEGVGLAYVRQVVLQQIPQLYQTVTAQEGRRLLIDGRWVCDFASCNYLGLDLHPEVKAAIPQALERWGVHPSWTRAVASPAIYRELEERLAGLVGAPAVLAFSCVTLLHMGVLPLLVGEDGALFVDSAAHRSIYEAGRLTQQYGAEFVEYPHGDLESLARHLARHADRPAKVIAIDGVYSMSGNHPDLPAYARLAQEHGASLYVDDAHGIGVVGREPDPDLPYGYGGGGTVRRFGLDYRQDHIVYVAGLSKAFSSFGAFVTCADKETKAKLATASTLVFSGPSPVASLASALAGLEINRREGDQLRAHIYRLTRKLVDEARGMGFRVNNRGYFPIVSLVVGRTQAVIEACQLLWQHGILITPALFPAVPLNQGAVRFSITAANTPEQVDQVLEALRALRCRLGPDVLQKVSQGERHET